MKFSNQNIKQTNTGCKSVIYKLQDDMSNQALILKTVNIENKRQSEHLRNQYQILSILKHRNIIEPILFKPNVSLNGTSSHVLILQYAQHGSLFDFIKKRSLSVENVRHIFKEILQSISYLHSENISHRDLKMQNILVFQKKNHIVFKLADFGFASSTIDLQNKQQKKVKGMKGTKRGYMAPEVITSLQSKQSYTLKQTDIFSLGVMLFALIFRKLPFQYATQSNQIYKYIWQQDFDSFWKYHEKQINKKQIQYNFLQVDDLKNLLQGMLCKSPQKRYSILDIIDHTWLKGQTQEPLP